MAQWLRAFAAVTEDLGSVPRIHMVVRNYSSQQFSITPVPGESDTLL